MAHNINYNEATGKHSFFSVQQKAWHGLGTIVENYPTSAEALKFAGLDFTVEKRKLFTSESIHREFEKNNGPFQPEIPIPGFYATVRTDTEQPLGIVGKDYQIVQNVDAFSFFDSIVGGDGIQYETAGALGKGERIFITAKLPDYIRINSDDVLEKYLFLTTSHDGYGSITAAFTPVRIVCNNTLNAALKNHSNVIKIRHTAGAKERLQTAHLLMGITNTLSDQLESIFKHWSKVRITDHQIKLLIQKAMAPNKEVLEKAQNNEDEFSIRFTNTCNEIFEYAVTAPSQQLETTKGTLFGVYNAVTGYYQNLKPFKTPEAKLSSLLYNGTAQTRAQRSFELCRQFDTGQLN